MGKALEIREIKCLNVCYGFFLLSACQFKEHVCILKRFKNGGQLGINKNWLRKFLRVVIEIKMRGIEKCGKMEITFGKKGNRIKMMKRQFNR